jgi:hypothetical protein
VSLLVLLDLQSIPLFPVFVFLVLFIFAYTHKIQKNSVASFTMGHEKGSSLTTKISYVIAISPNFKQF